MANTPSTEKYCAGKEGSSSSNKPALCVCCVRPVTPLGGALGLMCESCKYRL